MNKITTIDKIYVYTTIIEGDEKFVIDPSGVPFVYLTEEAMKESGTLKKMQQWANERSLTFRVVRFIPDMLVDVIEPMKTEVTQ